MTREDAITVLKQELSYLGGGPSPNIHEYEEALSVAIAALREQEREDPKPLTLDALRKMDGEPVWVKADHYGVYADVVHIMGQEDGERYVHFKINWRLQENGCGKTWLAYRHKPREEV